jgi:hypothetical protein
VATAAGLTLLGAVAGLLIPGRRRAAATAPAQAVPQAAEVSS